MMRVLCRKATEGEKAYMKRFDYWESPVQEFDYHYDNAETFLLIEGQATISYDEGTVSFGAGDILYCPAGLDCHWNVILPVKKYLR